LINNRQGGRRRGRGGSNRPPNSMPNTGNRQDNRSRGNAVQLHEKYKAMARDTQLAGDRVQTEYYLQFADHYYRILNENRARFEEQQQRRPRDDYMAEEDEDQGEEQDELAAAPEPRRHERQERQDYDRPRREERPPREERPERSGRGYRNGDGRTDRQREERQDGEPQAEERISLESLPPAIAIDSAEPAAPRRRTRRPRPDDEAEIAPAA
jgi:hypothetical protein